jgi:GNAT superfamily N-acetyltransferase
MPIRLASQSDAGGIARVHVLSWQGAYRGILPDGFLASLSVDRRRQTWADQLSNPSARSATLVATEPPDIIVGFASAGPAREAGIGFLGELYAVYLLAAFQRRGLGRALFRGAADLLLAQGLPSMMLWVLKANPTRGFYEHLGGVAYLERPITIGETEYPEIAYGWSDLMAAGAGRALPA